MLLVFDTGNSAATAPPPPSTVPAPGCAKNTLQVGGTRCISLHAPTTSLALVTLHRSDARRPHQAGRRRRRRTCSPPTATATSTPQLQRQRAAGNVVVLADGRRRGGAGAAVLHRRFVSDGRSHAVERVHPVRRAAESDADRRRAARSRAIGFTAAACRPRCRCRSNEQGFGFPVLDDALYFPGDARRRASPTSRSRNGLAQGETATLQLDVRAGTPLKVGAGLDRSCRRLRSASDPRRSSSTISTSA